MLKSSVAAVKLELVGPLWIAAIVIYVQFKNLPIFKFERNQTFKL